MNLIGIAITALLSPVLCFVPTNRNALLKAKGFRLTRGDLSSRITHASSNNSNNEKTDVVDELLELVERGKEESLEQRAIRDLITNLSASANDYVLDENSVSSLFEPLIGYYNVSCTLTSRPNDNPVGGKWTRGLWTVKRTLQHILPPLSPESSQMEASDKFKDQDGSFSVSSKAVAQVINAIRLELLWGFVGVWVLLRGDAVPLKIDPMYRDSADKNTDDSNKAKLLPNLSDRTVKAYFDRPRIGVSLCGGKKSKLLLKRVLSLGPTSAVILDTPYNDNRIRLGKGGTSGSQFVFSRLSETDEEAREGWKWVLEEDSKNAGGSLTKKALALRLTLFGAATSLASRILQRRWMKVLTGAYALFSVISIFGLIRSTGGIEKDDMYMEGNKV